MFSPAGVKPFEIEEGRGIVKVLTKSEGKKFNKNFRGQSFCTILRNMGRFQVLLRPKQGNHLNLTSYFLLT